MKEEILTTNKVADNRILITITCPHRPLDANAFGIQRKKATAIGYPVPTTIHWTGDAGCKIRSRTPWRHSRMSPSISVSRSLHEFPIARIQCPSSQRQRRRSPTKLGDAPCWFSVRQQQRFRQRSSLSTVSRRSRDRFSLFPSMFCGRFAKVASPRCNAHVVTRLTLDRRPVSTWNA